MTNPELSKKGWDVPELDNSEIVNRKIFLKIPGLVCWISAKHFQEFILKISD